MGGVGYETNPELITALTDLPVINFLDRHGFLTGKSQADLVAALVATLVTTLATTYVNGGRTQAQNS
ncbi:hypothetical protein OG762_24405 [Streptomyces sp. NBC_01136]|uniref:hypothetical protein n=1 Tax=unclassified Streptomyces TaxID=2593676 RepID=UPI00324BF6F1|nr:hypothetical protein OG762_24405 [Streptomyces sp. NBC_01136]